MNIYKGCLVKPCVRFWKGTVGEVIDILEDNEFPYVVEFEENETDQYSECQLEIVSREIK